jgi:acid-sensing ion channel, other
MSIVKPRVKICWNAAKDLFVDYAGHSSIHGVHYIAEKGRSWFEKVWWITALCTSIFCCGTLIFDAWNISPVIISFAEKPTPIWQIPFPAITICPDIFARIDHINLTKMMLHQEKGENIFQNLSETK